MLWVSVTQRVVPHCTTASSMLRICGPFFARSDRLFCLRVMSDDFVYKSLLATTVT